MAGPLNATVVLARCSKTKKCFGIRVEQRGKDWVRTWTFPIDERKAKHEGFETNVVTGSMDADNEYPGCPHCGAKGFVQCACKKNGCSGGIHNYGHSVEYTCPWCGENTGLKDVDSFNVSGGGY